MRDVLDLVRERDTSAYHLNGVRLPSVTECLALAGLVDFRGVPVRLLEEAARRGTLAHAAIAARNRGEAVGALPPDVEPYFGAYEKFCADTDFAPTLIEHPVLHLRYRYAGRLDAVGSLQGKLAVVDWKCTATVPAWTALQLAGYHLALGEEHRETRRYALGLHADGSYTLHRYSNPSDAADFLACVRVAWWHLKHGGIAL